MPLRPGSRVDRYTLVECLGEGGQGLVWKVYDPIAKVGRALKLVDLGRRPANAVTRARREARALAALEHPALVRCHALFELPGEDLLGLVFDLVRGRALSDLLDDARLGHAERVAILDHVAGALAYVHARGITHRDLKPENVLAADAFFDEPTRPGTVRLIDFGIAAPVGNPRPLTREGSVVGTDRYLPPELLSSAARPSGTDDGIARDLFGFGLLAWELLTGMHPTGASASDPAWAYSRVYDDAMAGRRPWPPSGFEGRSADFIASCLALDPLTRIDASRGLGQPLQLAPTHRSAALGATGAAHTAPMPVPTPGSVAPRARLAPTVTAAPTRAPRALAPIVKLVVLLGIATFVGAVMLLRWVAKTPALVEAPGNARPGPTAEPVATQASTPIPAPTPMGAGWVPCCPPPSDECNSGRACAPGACDARIPERGFRFRPQAVLRRGATGAFTESIPRLRVCIARTNEAEHCERAIPVDPGSPVLPSSIVLRTSDIERGALMIRVIDEGGRVVGVGQSAPNPEGIRVSALCMGAALYVGPRESAALRVTGFLDDL